LLHNFINQVNNDFLFEATNSPRLLEDLASMEKYMAESYGGRIFIELLQNADDANATKIKLCDYGNHLIFANNGRPFNEADVIAICRSGASSKERGVTIGYRGIGFKSTTTLTSEIIIYSDSTYFTFSKSICSKMLKRDENKIPTVRIPFLLENIEPDLDQYIRNLVYEGFSTFFIFMNARLNEMSDEVKEIKDGFFLFLNNIMSCQIKLKEQEVAFTINRDKRGNTTILSLSGNEDDQWLVVEDKETKLAFNYEDDKVVPCGNDEAVFHSYLPTLDKVIWPIKINCDFSTDPSRKHLNIDDTTTFALHGCADAVFGLIRMILNGDVNGSTYSNMITIFSQRLSFSKANTILNDNLKQRMTSSKWMKINNGQKINPVDYKILPDWLEESEKSLLRMNSKYIQANSISLEVYLTSLQVDNFLQQYSQSKYTSDDLIEIMKDSELVRNLNQQTQGKIFANIIKTGKSDQFISKKEYDYSDLMLQTNNGISPLSAYEKDKSIKLEKSFKDAINQYATRGDIEWFCKKMAIPEKEILSGSPTNNITDESDFKKTMVNQRFSISKWRSAEQQCVEIEKNLGYDAIDVSKQNVGYDIESVTKEGSKRYIEVKSINSGSPFSMTNNEYTAAYQYGDNYYLCLLTQTDKKLVALYIKNPLNSLQFEKRIRQWEWYCDNYSGEEFSIDY